MDGFCGAANERSENGRAQWLCDAQVLRAHDMMERTRHYATRDALLRMTILHTVVFAEGPHV